MPKKVSLDMLDIEEPTISTNEKRMEEEEEPDKSPVRWYCSRWFLISGTVFFVLFCAGLFLFFFRGSQKAAPRPASQSVSAVAAGSGKVGVSGRPVPIVEEVRDFLIPLKEGDEDSRILSLDMVFEIDPARRGLFKEKAILVREAIYKAVDGMAADIPKGKDGIEKVRATIIASLETLLGKGFVKNVWITKFVVL